MKKYTEMRISEFIDVEYIKEYGSDPRGMCCFNFKDGGYIWMSKGELKEFIDKLEFVHSEMK